MLQWLAIFATVFLAELGDKTQLATILFASKGALSPYLVFLAATAALCLSSALAVLFGTLLAQYTALIPLKLIAGIGFMAIGLWTVVDHLRGG